MTSPLGTRRPTRVMRSVWTRVADLDLVTVNRVGTLVTTHLVCPSAQLGPGRALWTSVESAYLVTSRVGAAMGLTVTTVKLAQKG